MRRAKTRRLEQRKSVRAWRSRPRRQRDGGIVDTTHAAAYDLCGSCGYLLDAAQDVSCPACGHDDRLSLTSDLIVDRLNDELDEARSSVPLRTQLMGTLIGSWAAIGAVALAVSVDQLLWSTLPAAGAVAAGGFALPTRAARRHAALAGEPLCRWRRPLPLAPSTVPGGEWNGVVRGAPTLIAPWSGRACIAYRWQVSIQGADGSADTLVLDEARSAACEFGAFPLVADRLLLASQPLSRVEDRRAELDAERSPADRAALACLRSRGLRPGGLGWHVTEDVVLPGERVEVSSDGWVAVARPVAHHLAVA